MSEIIKKVWGEEEILVNNELYCAKYLRVNKGSQSSLHRHIVKDETFLLVSGKILLEVAFPLKMTRTILQEGDNYRITPGKWHRFTGLSKKNTILEISTHHKDSDVERKENSR